MERLSYPCTCSRIKQNHLKSKTYGWHTYRERSITLSVIFIFFFLNLLQSIISVSEIFCGGMINIFALKKTTLKKNCQQWGITEISMLNGVNVQYFAFLMF